MKGEKNEEIDQKVSSKVQINRGNSDFSQYENQRTDTPTDRQTDRSTDRQTD
jgi:hypothetical protein